MLLTPEVNKLYAVKVSGRTVPAKFIGEIHSAGWHSQRGDYHTNATCHYEFVNLATGRKVVLKSRVKILREVENVGVNENGQVRYRSVGVQPC